MKKLILSLICAGVVSCACSEKNDQYEAPSLISPNSGSNFSFGIIFEWNANNHASEKTKDYNFRVVIASDPECKQIKNTFITKLEQRYELPSYILHSGTYYWKVVGAYQNDISSSWTEFSSEIRSFTYD